MNQNLLRNGKKIACITLDVESDIHWSTNIVCELFEKPAVYRNFCSIIKNYHVNLSCFVVGKVLEQHPEYIDALDRIDAEFELHSYSHQAHTPDSEEEIAAGRRIYEHFFHTSPKGYRAPAGLISTAGLERLKTHGFLYDSSVIPTLRFDEYHYFHLDKPTLPYRTAAGIIELPLAVFPGVRIPISLSYLKLLGAGAFGALRSVCGYPPILIFDSHPFDYLLTKGVVDRRGWKRILHLRNVGIAMRMFDDFLANLVENGYEFYAMSQLFTLADTRNAPG